MNEIPDEVFSVLVHRGKVPIFRRGASGRAPTTWEIPRRPVRDGMLIEGAHSALALHTQGKVVLARENAVHRAQVDLSSLFGKKAGRVDRHAFLFVLNGPRSGVQKAPWHQRMAWVGANDLRQYHLAPGVEPMIRKGLRAYTALQKKEAASGKPGQKKRKGGT